MAKSRPVLELEKCPTGIKGFDEISGGGLPLGRPTLVAGRAGCGKTVFAMEFIVKGAVHFNEPGVFVSFEESADDLVRNFSSLGYSLNDLMERKKIALDYVFIERSEIEEAGEYDLEGLFIRLAHAIDSVKAKRIALDTVESLFSGFSNEGLLRAELRRLLRWLKDRGVTAVITGESGENTLTRYGLEEYIADCVIQLDFRVREQISTRRLRIIKYRGSHHGTDEYPFLIDKTGISILPVTSLGLDHKVSSARISTGIPRLDNMLGGKGFYRGSAVLISGTAGTGKTSLAVKFVEAACKRGERCLYLAFEESAHQIMRNMKSIGVDLASCLKEGTLKFHASRPSLHGLEMHLATIHEIIAEYEPQIVVVDPLSNLTAVGTSVEVKSILMRLLDYLKICHITVILTDLIHFGETFARTREEVSSLIDTWILLRDTEMNGERNKVLSILKSRGMAHSNQVRELVMSDGGIDLADVYLGQSGVMTGSARAAQEAKEKREAAEDQDRISREIRKWERNLKDLEGRIETLPAKYAAASGEFQLLAAQDKTKREEAEKERLEMAKRRKADSVNPRKFQREKILHR